MSDPISLAAARAAKEQDGNLWSPIDCLRQIIKDIEEGIITPSAVHVSLKIQLPDDNMQYRWYQAGLTRAEQIALMAVAQKELIEDWAV